jgi:hypothetical protein
MKEVATMACHVSSEQQKILTRVGWEMNHKTLLLLLFIRITANSYAFA